MVRSVELGGRALDHVFKHAPDLEFILLDTLGLSPPHWISFDLKLLNLLLYQLVLKRRLIFYCVKRRLGLEGRVHKLRHSFTTCEPVSVGCS